MLGSRGYFWSEAVLQETGDALPRAPMGAAPARLMLAPVPTMERTDNIYNQCQRDNSLLSWQVLRGFQRSFSHRYNCTYRQNMLTSSEGSIIQLCEQKTKANINDHKRT